MTPKKGVHAKDGWYFLRAPDGGVTIHITPADVTYEEVTLDANMWCWIVTEMTLRPDAEAFRRVQFLHEGDPRGESVSSPITRLRENVYGKD